MLVLAVVDRALRKSFITQETANHPLPVAFGAAGQIDLNLTMSSHPVNLRRQTGLVLRSGAIRNLHDLVMAIGLGADAVAPYLLFEAALGDVQRKLEPGVRLEKLGNTLKALRTGVEKVISTMGIHELRGYGRLFGSIGLSQPVAGVMGTANYGGSEEGGLTWKDIDADISTRAAVARGDDRAQLSRINHFYPKVWKTAGRAAGVRNPGRSAGAQQPGSDPAHPGFPVSGGE
jgi:glutamate synthase (NADPH/NADH) large chain